MSLKILEKNIQRQILQYLRLKKIFAFKLNNVGIKKVNGSYIPSGILGLPDIIAHYDGRVVYLEIKSETGKLSKHQIAFQEQCKKDSVQYLVIRSFSDLIRILNIR